MSKLKQLLEDAKREQAEQKAQSKEKPYEHMMKGIVEYIYSLRIENFNRDFAMEIIKTFSPVTATGRKYDAEIEKVAHNTIEKYYSVLPHTITILDKSTIENGMTGYHYMIRFVDGSYFTAGYVLEARILYFPLPGLCPMVLEGVEKKLLEQGVVITE